MTKLLKEILLSNLPASVRVMKIKEMNIRGNDTEARLIQSVLKHVNDDYDIIEILKNYYITDDFKSALDIFTNYLL